MGLTKPRAAQIFDLDYKQATRVVTTTNITLSSGAPSSVDGVSLTLNDRILVTAQTTGSQNGLYLVTTVGSGSNGTWARTSDGNDTGEIEAGMIVMVTEGAVYADTQWKLITDNPIVIGTTTLTFTQNYSANSISGGTSNVRVFSNANVTISSAGTPNVLIVSSTGTIVTGTESVTGNITGGNVLTIGLISAAGNITGNYFLGNVACASGIYASRIFNGTSEANIPTSGGNANISIGGFSNVAVFASTGEYLQGILSVTGNIISAGNITGGNANITGTTAATSKTTGALVVGGGVGVASDVWAGNSVTVDGGAYGNVVTTQFASLYATGSGPNPYSIVQVRSNDGTTGMGIQAYAGLNGKIYSNSGITFTTGATIKDKDFPTGGTSRATIDSTGLSVAGIASASGNVTGGNILTGGNVSATGNIAGNYVLGNVFYANGITASKIYNGTSEANVGTSGGNANISIGGTSNVVVFASTGEYVSGLLSVTGNVTGGNIVATTSLTNGNITITGASIISSGVTLTIDPNGSGSNDGNVIIAGNLSVTGNMTYINSNNVTTNDLAINMANNAATAAAANGGGIGVGPAGSEYISLTYNSTSNTWVASNGLNVQGITSASGNVTGGNVLTGGLISATGNITGNYLLANIAYATGYTASKIYNGTSEANIGTSGGNANISIGGTSNVVVFAPTGEYVTGVVSVTGNIIGNKILVGSGNVNSPGILFSADASQDSGFYWSGEGNIGVAVNGNVQAFFNTSGLNVTGNLTVGNISTSTFLSTTVSATGNINGANIVASANIIGGNITTVGLISSTGTITSGANITGANILTGGLISSTGTITSAATITGGNLGTGGTVSALGNITGSYHIGNGSVLTGINAFKTIAVTGQSNVVANSIASTLTFAAGTGIALTTDTANGIVTFSTATTNSIFSTGGDMGLVTDAVTASEDLGNVTDAVTVSYDLGSVVSASGLIYPSQLILPTYTVATLPSATPAAQFVYLSTSSVGAMTAFSDGTNWRFTSSGSVVS